MSKKYNCLVLCREQEDVYKMNSAEAESTDMSKILGDHSVTFSHLDEFIEEVRHDTFDFIIVSLAEEDLSPDDLEMQQECFEYYTKAPVFAWSLSKGQDADLSKVAKTFHKESELHFFDHTSLSERAASFVKLFNWCVSTYTKKCDGEVAAAFKKFDLDGSGSIDKKEL